MFIGHYGAALAARRWTPRLSLGWLFVAVQLLDLAFSVLLLAGVEWMRIEPGFTATNPYVLEHMPYTHSLVGALAWAVAAGLVTRALLGREGWAAALAMAVCVASHWFIDLPVHTPDLPLLPGPGDGAGMVGLGLWNHLGLALAAEVVVFAAGAALWAPATGGWQRAPGRTLGFLVAVVAVGMVTPFLPPPADGHGFAVQAIPAYVALAAAAAWIDRVRR